MADMVCWGVPREINIDACVLSMTVEATNMALSAGLMLFIHSLICIYQHRVVRSAIGVTIKINEISAMGNITYTDFGPWTVQLFLKDRY